MLFTAPNFCFQKVCCISFLTFKICFYTYLIYLNCLLYIHWFLVGSIIDRLFSFMLHLCSNGSFILLKKIAGSWRAWQGDYTIRDLASCSSSSCIVVDRLLNAGTCTQWLPFSQVLFWIVVFVYIYVSWDAMSMRVSFFSLNF
jgi:hypothetical protein